jgi:hypothetical protein
MRITVRKWCFLLGVVCVAVIAGIMLINFFMDSSGYFSKLQYGQSGFDQISVINAKYRYITENPDLYTGFIVGGSRTGAIDPAVVSNYTGLSFFNFSFPYGNYPEYERIVNFIIDTTSVKHIILQMNGGEVALAEEIQNVFGHKLETLLKLEELSKELLADCSVRFAKFILKMPVYDPKSKENGMIEYIEQYSPQKREKLKFVDDCILPGYGANYKNIFTDKQMDEHQPIYASLIKIKSNCARNGVTLTLILSPSSPTVLSHHESPDYWEYLRNIAMISGFYNFNGYAPYNFNPYNFVDRYHYRKEMADKMLRIVFGQEAPEDDWGILLTPETIDAYLERRKATYYRLKKEYEETGTLAFGTMHDPSFIPPRPQ